MLFLFKIKLSFPIEKPKYDGWSNSFSIIKNQLITLIPQFFDEFGRGFESAWNSPKNLLCWQKIFGYIERFVPACDGQVIAQSLWSVLEEGEQTKRSFDWIYDRGKYFPLDSDRNLEIGYNCAGDEGAGLDSTCWGGLGSFSKLMTCKNFSPIPVIQRQREHCQTVYVIL